MTYSAEALVRGASFLWRFPSRLAGRLDRLTPVSSRGCGNTSAQTREPEAPQLLQRLHRQRNESKRVGRAPHRHVETADGAVAGHACDRARDRIASCMLAAAACSLAGDGWMGRDDEPRPCFARPGPTTAQADRGPTADDHDHPVECGHAFGPPTPKPCSHIAIQHSIVQQLAEMRATSSEAARKAALARCPKA